MSLLPLEQFAFMRVFDDVVDALGVVRRHLPRASVVERTNTGVGGFVTIQFPEPITLPNGRALWDWNFAHRALSHGGSWTPENLEMRSKSRMN